MINSINKYLIGKRKYLLVNLNIALVVFLFQRQYYYLKLVQVWSLLKKDKQKEMNFVDKENQELIAINGDKIIIGVFEEISSVIKVDY